MLFSSSTSSKQQRRARVLSQAARLESLETRQMLSTWYVSNAGADSAAGSMASPWASVQYAIDRAAANDTIILRGGTYNGNLKITKAGLTIKGQDGEVAKIASPTTNSAVEVTIRIGENANNTKLINLDISGGYYYTIKTESTWDTGAALEYGPKNLLISNSKLHDSGRDVVKLTPGTDYSVIESTEIYNSGRRDPSNAEGIDAVQANYATLRDSYIHDTTTNGVYYKGGSIGTVIERNRVTRIAYSGILLGQSSDENWFDTAKNPKYYESIDSIVRNNIVWDVEGAGIGAWAALRPQIYNNTLYDVAQSMFGGLLVQGQEHWIPDSTIVPSTDVQMYNNVVMVNSSRPVLEVRDGGLTGYLKSNNNLFYQPGKSALIRNTVSGFEGGLIAWKAAGFDTNSLEGNPSLDSSYHLTSSSVAINKGMTISGFASDYDKQARPSGPAYDIGADEFNGTPTTPDDTTPTGPGTTDPGTTDPGTPTTPTYVAQWSNSAVANQTGTFNLEFDATPKMANMDMVVGLSNGAADAVSDLGAIVRFNTSGRIDARNGSTYGAAASVAYTAGKQYHVKLVVNVATRTYDVYVTPAGGSAVKIASGYAFRSEQATVTLVNNVGRYNETGDATISNITVSAVTITPPTTTLPTGWKNSSIGTQTGRFTLDFDAKAGQTNEVVKAGVGSGVVDALGEYVAAIRFNAKGYIDARNGSVWASLKSFAYSANATYHFTLDINMATKTYDVYLKTPTGTQIKLATGWKFQVSTSSVNTFVVDTSYGGTLTTSAPVVKQVTTSTGSTPTTVTPTPSTTANLALNKTTTASSTQGSGLEANLATDGNTATRWSSGEVDTAWVQVDLGATYNIGTVKLNWEYASARSYEIQVSSDGVNWTIVNTQTAGAQGTAILAATGTGRYVRLNCTAPNTSWGYSLWSFEVYGR